MNNLNNNNSVNKICYLPLGNDLDILNMYERRKMSHYYYYYLLRTRGGKENDVTGHRMNNQSTFSLGPT